MKISKWLIMLLSVVILEVGCGDGSSGDGGNGNNGSEETGGTTENQVIIPVGVFVACDASYDPFELTVSVGTVVTWRNDDIATHTVTSSTGTDCNPDDAISQMADRELDSPFIVTGGTFSHTFDTEGIFNYVCVVLAHRMWGRVIVTAD